MFLVQTGIFCLSLKTLLTCPTPASSTLLSVRVYRQPPLLSHILISQFPEGRDPN